MGSIYAGLLADAGNEVWAVDVWREHVAAIQSGGLRIEGASGDRIVRLRATTEPGDVGAVRPRRYRHQGAPCHSRGHRGRKRC